jgi:hypothetical protein
MRQHAQVIAYRVVMQVTELTDDLGHRQAAGGTGQQLGNPAARGMG